jgi:hypothetical protein
MTGYKYSREDAPTGPASRSGRRRKLPRMLDFATRGIAKSVGLF